MEQIINQDELNALLAAEIRKVGLNDTLKLDMVREKVLKKLEEMQGGINEMENPVVSKGPNTFPNPEEDEEQFKTAPQISTEQPPAVGIEPGSQYPLNTPVEPKMAIIPEIPDFLKEVEPGKIFVYDFNELSVGGENLSNKPFKTLGDPDVSKSMQQMWSEKGITKAEVYQTKFEKAGEIVFDYKSGQSQFIERSAEPDFDIQQQYKSNPYAAQPEKEVENYIKQNIDIDQKINDVISNIVKTYFLTNSERAVNDPNTNTFAQTPQISYAQAQMAEGELKMKDIVNECEKIDTPQELVETILGKSKKAKLVFEGVEVKKWILGDKEYYTPSNPMSIRMCYSK